MTKKHPWSLLFGVVGLMLLSSTSAEARGRGRRGPPPAAYEACANKKVGDACTFDCLRGGPVEGTCQIRWDDRLSCFPKDRVPRRGRQ